MSPGPRATALQGVDDALSPGPTRARPTVASAIRPLLELSLDDHVPVGFEFWDGSAVNPATTVGTVVVGSPDAVRALLWAPGELGLARAFVVGDLAVRGDLFGVLEALRNAERSGRRLGPRRVARALEAARKVGALGPPTGAPAEEARPQGLRHSPVRDAQVIRHHYDVGNEFYAMVLGATMTYSCARFDEATTTLDDAQHAKHDLICRKLGLDARPGVRLLDVGCGWGAMALHAAQVYGARVLGITLSDAQAELARRRVKEAGLDEHVEICVEDYRELRGERFDAVSSIGMFEHVGRSKMATYFETVFELLGGTGRLLNHAISSVGGVRFARRSFIGRYVFPDGELIDVGEVALAMERAGFEVRDVESLREHYARTLRSWVHNLDEHWDEAIAEVGARRARVWRLYMAASANAFEAGRISVHQVLGVRTGAQGASGMPSTRRAWA